jgi:hypothetical protein
MMDTDGKFDWQFNGWGEGVSESDEDGNEDGFLEHIDSIDTRI